MDTPFTIRLDKLTKERLQVLAYKSFRSRAEVVRMLIHLAWQNPQFLYPDVEILPDDNSVYMRDSSLLEKLRR